MSENNERKALLSLAKDLNLEFPTNIPTDKLKAMVEEATGEKIETIIVEKDTVEKDTVEVSAELLADLQAQITELKEAKVDTVSNGESVDGISALIKALQQGGSVLKPNEKGLLPDDSINKVAVNKRANTLIRCKVTSNNPYETYRKGEMITVSNDVIGSIKGFVPFRIITHIPYFVAKVLESKTIEIYDETMERIDPATTGVVKGGSKTMPAYDITVLDPLTRKEIALLAKKQALTNDNIDERSEAILGIDKEEEVVEDKFSAYNV